MTVQPKVILYYDTDSSNFYVKAENVMIDGRPFPVAFTADTRRGYEEAFRTVGLGIEKWFHIGVEKLLRTYRPDDLQKSSLVYTVGTEIERKPHVLTPDQRKWMQEGAMLRRKEMVDNHA